MTLEDEIRRQLNDDPRFADNEQAHEVLNSCILNLAQKVKDVEEYMVNLPTPDKVYYKPKGEEEYLNLKSNLDLIYSKLEALEARLNG